MATTTLTPPTATRTRRAAPDDLVAVANRLRPVLLHLTRELRRETRELGISAGQASLLAVIHGYPGIGVSELAARERMSPPSMCTHIDRLAAAGLVERVRGGTPGDRRRVGLTVTAEGVRVLRAVRSRRTAWLAAHLRRLDPADVAAIDAAVDPLQRLLDGGRA